MKKVAELLPGVQLQPHQQRVSEEVTGDSPRVLLYHGLGSGKSLSALAAAEAAKAQFGDNYGVVVPASLRGNFQKEVKKFTDSQPEIVSYTGLGMGKQFKDQPKTLIMDEAARLRNPDALSTQAAFRAAQQADRLMLLTGTPITNEPSDLAAILSMLNKQQITPEQFDKEYVDNKKVWPGLFGWMRGATAGVRPVLRNGPKLRKLLEGKVDYQPSKTPEGVNVNEQIIRVPLSNEQQRIQQAVRTKVPPGFLWKLDKEFPLSRQELSKLNSFMTGLRQVGLSTQPFRADKDPLRAFQQSAKMQEAFKNLKSTLESDPRKKAIIYSNFVDSGLNPYAAGLTQAGIPHGAFHGGISAKARQAAIADYNAGKLRALLIGPAGAEGISTKGTSLIQLMDPHWNEARSQQASGRGLRFDSHDNLPEELKNVAVQRYISTSKDPSLLGKFMGYRRERTGDEVLERLTAEKEKLNEEFRNLLREVGSKKDEDQEEEKTGSSKQAVDIAITAIVNDKDETLVIRRSPESDRTGEWESPAGHVDKGEDPQESAKREVKEETGLDVKIEPAAYTFDIRDGKNATIYLARLTGRPAVKLRPDEHDQHKWLSLDALDSLTPTPPNWAKNMTKIIKLNELAKEATMLPPNASLPPQLMNNSYGAMFPYGGRLPHNPNPLSTAAPVQAVKADAAGVQQAMAKRGAQDNKGPRRSATGESKAVSYKLDDTHHHTGQKAIDTLENFRKKADLNSFQAHFFGRLVDAGMSEAQIRAAVKTASDKFGGAVATELHDGLEKIANALGIGKLIGSGLGWAASKAAPYAARMMPWADDAARGAASAVRSGAQTASNVVKQPGNFVRGIANKPMPTTHVPGIGAVRQFNPAYATGQAARNFAKDTVTQPFASGTAGQLARGQAAQGAMTGALNPYTGIFSEGAYDNEGNVNWGRLAASTLGGALAGRAAGQAGFGHMANNMQRQAIAGESIGGLGAAASNAILGTDFDPAAAARLGFGAGAIAPQRMKGIGVPNTARGLEAIDPTRQFLTRVAGPAAKAVPGAARAAGNWVKSNPSGAAMGAGALMGGYGLASLPGQVTQTLDDHANGLRAEMQGYAQNLTNRVDQHMQPVSQAAQNASGFMGAIQNGMQGLGQYAQDNQHWLAPAALGLAGAGGGYMLGGREGALLGGLSLPMLHMLAQQGAFNQQGGQQAQPQQARSYDDEIETNRQLRELLEERNKQYPMLIGAQQPMENEIQRQQAMQGS
jgi:8-oxo-dGTP pyrophosphatase MutT (NUDIX family)